MQLYRPGPSQDGDWVFGTCPSVCESHTINEAHEQYGSLDYNLETLQSLKTVWCVHYCSLCIR